MINIEEYFKVQKVENIKKGVTILSPEDTVKDLIFLEQGYVRQYYAYNKGFELTIHIFMPGTFFPLYYFLNKSPNKYFFEALTNVKIKKCNGDEVEEVLTKNPGLSVDLNKRLVSAIEKLAYRVEILACSDANERVFSTLEYFASHFGEGVKKGKKIKMHFTHREIASFAGLTRETVSREIDNLTKSGKIHVEGKYFIIIEP